MSEWEPSSDLTIAAFDLLASLREIAWAADDQTRCMADSDQLLGHAISGWVSGVRPLNEGASLALYTALNRLLFALPRERVREVRRIALTYYPVERRWDNPAEYPVEYQ